MIAPMLEHQRSLEKTVLAHKTAPNGLLALQYTNSRDRKNTVLDGVLESVLFRIVGTDACRIGRRFVQHRNQTRAQHGGHERSEDRLEKFRVRKKISGPRRLSMREVHSSPSRTHQRERVPQDAQRDG